MGEPAFGSEQLLKLDTRCVPKGDRLDYYRQFLADADSLKLASSERDFVGQIKKVRFDDCALYRLTVETPHRVIRSKRNDSCVATTIHLRAGGCTVHGKREFALASGELTILNAAADYELDYRGGATLLALVVPRARLEEYVPNLSSLCDRNLECDKMFVAALSQLCTQFLGTGRTLSLAVKADLAGSIIGLLGATLLDFNEQLPQPSTWTQHALLRRAKSFIREHIDQSDLSPPVIAKSVGITVGYLHRLFQLEGSSVMRFVISERLDRARAKLSRARTADSIGQIAFACGFNDSSHFARAFRQRFGISPREYKSEAVRHLVDRGTRR